MKTEEKQSPLAEPDEQQQVPAFQSGNPERIYSSCAVDLNDLPRHDAVESTLVIKDEVIVTDNKDGEKATENAVTSPHTVVIKDEATPIVTMKDVRATVEVKTTNVSQNKPAKIDNSVEQPQATTEQVKRSNEKVAKWIDNNNDTLEKIRMETCGDFEKEYYGLLSQQGVNPFHMNPPQPRLASPPPASPAPYRHPVRFIQIRPMPGTNTNNPANPGILYPPGAVRFVRMPLPGASNSVSTAAGTGTINRPEMPYIIQFGSVKEAEAAGAVAMTSPPPVQATVGPEKAKKNTELKKTQGKPVSITKTERRKRKSDSGVIDASAAKILPQHRVNYRVSSGIPQYPKNAEDIYKKHLLNVEVELHNKELWEGFNKAGTEMILTRNGRYVFLSLVAVTFKSIKTRGSFVASSPDNLCVVY